MRLGIRGWVKSVAVMAAMALLCASTGAPRAKAAVYWGSGRDGVGAANLDGSNPQWDYFYWPYPAESQGPPCGVAVNSEYLYWAAPGGIGRRNLNSEGLYPATIVPHLDGPCGLALDGGHIYWGDRGGHPPSGPRAGSLGRANLDGSEANNTFVTGLERPCDVTVGGGHVYWIEDGGIGRANLDGSNPERPFIPLSARNGGCGLTASGGYLYWGQNGAIPEPTSKEEKSRKPSSPKPAGSTALRFRPATSTGRPSGQVEARASAAPTSTAAKPLPPGFRAANWNSAASRSTNGRRRRA